MDWGESMQRPIKCAGWVAFIATLCVPVILIALCVTYTAGMLLAIAYSDKLYAMRLDNPYVDSQFEGWKLEDIGHKSIMIPREWELTQKDGTLQVLMEGKPIATGIATGEENMPFKTVDAFLSHMFGTTVSEVEYAHTYSLLSSSFGKLYINGSQQPLGYYIEISNIDGFCFLCFQDVEYTESELKSIAEAIIFYYQYPQ